MAQDKIKVKTNASRPAKKNKPVKNKGGVKKGKFEFTSKNKARQQIQKFKKEIQKGINANIEAEVKAAALKEQEGKAFKAINSTGGHVKKDKAEKKY